MWPFTGGCHYDNYCGKYLYSCRECPQLGNKKNITKERIEKKAELYKACNIQFVGCSSWITEQFNNSFIGKKQTTICINIPNPINDFESKDKIVDSIEKQNVKRTKKRRNKGRRS